MIGIIITHGHLAEELLKTAATIVGELHDCFALSGAELCDDEVVERITGILKSGGDGEAFLFVDYFGGSCCTSCVRASRPFENVKVISGVNLPMILDFVTKQDTMGMDDLADHLIHRGRESVRTIDL